MKIQKILFARELRKLQTPSENILWRALRNRRLLNLKFHRQYIILGFILDFYCPALRLGIEVDGGIHNLKENKVYDTEREKIIKQYKINIIRFANENIKNNLTEVIDQIETQIIKIKRNLYP
ncbi:MAG: endonuclease domain-containing protein [Candidatus Falkowbacteria bacterium]|nr:endonuclease domain-containing protein [Candidatus Falkowbacteria bacterium]